MLPPDDRSARRRAHPLARLVDHLGRQRIAPRTSVTLDAARALAALVVAAGHLRSLLFVPYTEVAHPGAAATAFYAVTAIGRQSVMIFFVLSGLLVGGSIARALRQRAWSWRWYLSRRMTRLYVALLPALLLTAALDHLGARAFRATHVYDALPSDRFIILAPVLERATLTDFGANLLFLQTIVRPTFGSNFALWSLTNEFWYYILFPTLLLAAFSGPKWRLAYAALGASIAALLGAERIPGFGVWLLGLVALALPRDWVSERTWLRRSLLAGAVALHAAALLAARRLATPVGDTLVGITFAAVLYTLLALPMAASPCIGGWRERVGRVWRALSAFSYTLYLVHTPVFVFAAAALRASGERRWQPDAPHLAAAAALLALVVAFAYLVSLPTEARTDRIRRALFARHGESDRPERAALDAAA